MDWIMRHYFQIAILVCGAIICTHLIVSEIKSRKKFKSDLKSVNEKLELVAQKLADEEEYQAWCRAHGIKDDYISDLG